MYKYVYEGPVLEFGRCVVDHWKAETVADSEKKARSNIAFQYKKLNNRIASTKVTLPGRIVLIKTKG